MRKSILPFTLPDLDDSELNEIKEVLDSGWITTGPKTKQLEKIFSESVDSQYALAVNSGTAAMHLSLEAVGIGSEDEVITSTYTFAATAEVIRYFGAKPVFVDICSNDFNVDPEKIKRAITQKTRAIIPIHIGGLPAEMEEICDIARRHHLAVIEDAAHAYPAKYKKKTIGSIGDFTCFSFYATKPVTTGEGGMICTQNKAWAERCGIMALHGISQDAWKRYTKEGSWYYEIVAPGYKYNMADIGAAIGLVQMKKAEHMWQRRREIARKYNDAFKSIESLQIPFERVDCQHAWHLYMIRLHLDHLTIDRARFIQELENRKIKTSVHFIPLHTHPYYRKTYGYKPEDFPVAYQEYLREISLPIYSKMTNQDVEDVIEAVKDVAFKYRI